MPIAQVARDLGIPHRTLRNWVAVDKQRSLARRPEGEDQPRPGVQSSTPPLHELQASAKAARDRALSSPGDGTLDQEAGHLHPDGKAEEEPIAELSATTTTLPCEMQAQASPAVELPGPLSSRFSLKDRLSAVFRTGWHPPGQLSALKAAWLDPTRIRSRWNTLGLRFTLKDRLSAGSWRRWPMSRQGRRFILAILVMLSAMVFIVRTSVQVAALFYLLYMGFALALGVIGVTSLVWMLHAWRTPESFAQSTLSRDDGKPTHSFSLIVPARHEESVLETTLARLVMSDHPDFEVIVVVGDDDPATRDVAERAADRHPELIKVIVDASYPKNKPKALNAALPHCSGTVTGVFDAEDDVHPALLQRVDQCFQRTGADVVQAGVQLMNFRSSWLTVHNVLEYYFWFRSRLHRHARQRFIPLGGNTVFIRTQILRAVDGWDSNCLAEDCELGVRLSALGAQTAVFYEPELVTREECPPTLGAFVRQRTRWNQGYLQTLSKGYWRRLPLRQRALGFFILAMPFAMAVAWLLIPVAIATAIFLKVPVTFSLISFMPLFPMLCMLAVDMAGLVEFCRAYGERTSLREWRRLVLGLPLYQAILTLGAARAVLRQARGVQAWDKTTHLGLHLGPPAHAGRTRSASLPARSQRTAALRGSALSALRWRAQNPEPLLAEADDLAPSLAAFVPVQTSASSHRAPEQASDTLGGDPVVGPAGNSPRYDRLQVWPGDGTGRANGNGSNERSRFDHLFESIDGRALWVRLGGLQANGAAPGSPLRIPPASSTRSARTRLGDIRSVLGRLARRRIDIAVQIPLLIGLGLVQATNMVHWPFVLFDEGTYVGNAWAFGERGELGFYTYTYGHPPLAWVLISVWTSVRGLLGHAGYSLDEARELMCVISIVSFSLLYILARRLKMNPVFAAATVILFALCPLSLYFHRGVELDNPATVWAIAAFALALSPRRRLWSFAGSGACFAASVLSKETTLVMLPALLLAAFQNTDSRTRRYCMALMVSFLVLIGLAYPLYATLKGELIPGPNHVSLIGTDINMLFTRQGTGSVFDSNSGAHTFVTFWLSYDPWLLGAALLLSPIALANRALRPAALAFVIQVAIVLRPGYLPAMYVIAMLPFAALIVAGTIQVLWRFVVDSIHALWRFATGDRTRRQTPAAKAKWGVISCRAAILIRTVAVAASVLTIGVAAVATVHVAPEWARTDRSAMTVQVDDPVRAAERWLLHRVGRGQRLIVTDDFWVYLIGHGFDSQPVRGGFNSPTVISYWPLDKDPAVRRYLPLGWREFNYIVSNGDMRKTAKDLPNTADALKHSRLVAGFGYGYYRIEIRAITPTPLDSGTVTASRTRQFRVPVSANTPSLNQVAHTLRVSVQNIISQTNRYPEDPAWWYYEASSNYRAPLPPRTILHYTVG
jgi:cellulose synthase/poly-beta-1,6-N-acetylglucosamine synthase-like glycosyltransferase